MTWSQQSQASRRPRSGSRWSPGAQSGGECTKSAEDRACGRQLPFAFAAPATSADFAAAVTTFGIHSSRILVTWAAKWRAPSRRRPRRRSGCRGGGGRRPDGDARRHDAHRPRRHGAPPGRRPGDTSRAVAEAARRAAWSVGKLFLVLQRDRRRDHSPLRMPPPALIHVCVKNHS